MKLLAISSKIFYLSELSELMKVGCVTETKKDFWNLE